MWTHLTQRRWKTLALLAVMVMLLVMPASVLASVEPAAQITAPALNVRAGPSAGFPVKGVVYQYEWVTLLGRNANSSWVRIETDDGLKGWVSTLYINPNVALSSLPVVNGVVEPTASVNAPVLNVREGPSPYYDVVTTVYRYTVLSLIGRNHDASWVEVRVTGKKGWVNSSYIIPYYDLFDLPVTSGDVAPPETPVEGAMGTVFAQALNVRSGAGIDYAPFTVLYFGTTVDVLGRDSSNGWLAIKIPQGGRGWVSSLYVSLNVPLSSLPVITASRPTGEVITGALYMREGPGMGYSITNTLPNGAVVRLLGRNYDASWLRVNYNGNIGWVGAGGIATGGYPLMSLPAMD